MGIYHYEGWTGPSWEGGNVVSKSGVVNLVDKDAEKGSGLVTGVRLKRRVDLDDERRGDCGKKTGLRPYLVSTQLNLRWTYENQGRVQILVMGLGKFFVVLLSDTAVVIVESRSTPFLSG